MAKLYNLVKMTSATTGTGTLTLGSAVSSYLTFAQAGVANGDVVTYAIVDGTQREVGRGTYTSAGTTLSRDTVLDSTNGGSKISCTGAQYVGITISAEDIAVNYLAQGRLTLASGTAITTTDQTAKTTIYYALYNGDKIDLYETGAWNTHVFAELSLALGTLTSGKNYDVFIYNNAGTLTMELSAAWTNDTTRADALTTQNGIFVKSGAVTRRYIGTIRTTSTTTTEDSLAKRFVWNMYNRVPRNMQVLEATASWTWGTASWHQANAAAANQLAYVSGVSDSLVSAVTQGRLNVTSTQVGAVGIGVDSTSANSAQLVADVGAGDAAGVSSATSAFYAGYPGLGYHYLPWLEYARAGTVTFYGPTVADISTGILGVVAG